MIYKFIASLLKPIFYQKGRIKMKPVSYYNVKYLPNSTLKEKFERNVNWMLSLTPDQLLYNYRINAGLDTKGATPLTVWESPDWFFRGHFTGHYLSGASRSFVELNNMEDTKEANELKKLSKIS